MQLSLAQVGEATGAQFDGLPHSVENIDVQGWSIDSRTVAPGDLFFALKGEHFDGHQFVAEVLEKGAAAAIVSEDVTAVGAVLKVDDTLAALQKLAHWARVRWNRPVVAVTGSAGKTSTKDIIAALLAVRLRVGKTVGNFNNHIGLPLTLLRIADDAEVAVVEMGMNHAGEIRQLAAIAEPQFGVVTNVGYAHVENFASIEGVAAAKRELIEGLAPGGTAVLNADDERALQFRESHGGPAITYGFSAHADVRATEVEINPDGSNFIVNEVRFHSKLTGRHAVSNILAGLAVASLFGIPLDGLVEAVAQLSPGKMRGERLLWNGIVVLNDSYNSNPEAARNMIDVLKAEPAGRRIAVLGEMLELGAMAEELHRDLGNYVVHSGIDVLIAIRGAARFLVEEAEKRDPSNRAAFFFDDAEAAGDFLRNFVKSGDAILFKGSRGTHVERALARMEA